jgi:DNA replication protein DnaC
MSENPLLDTYLKQLRLPTFLQNYPKFAEDAAQANLTYDRFLLSLAEQEVCQREINREMRRIKAARFPVLKELADFDFSCVTRLNKLQVLDLAQGSYIQKDVELSAIIDKCSAYTPVPGGVGPMTIVTLIAQTVEAAEKSA